MSRWLKPSEWFGPGPIQAVLLSVRTERRTLRVLIAGKEPPYRCVVDMPATAGTDDWPPRLDIGPGQIRELRHLLARALSRDTQVTAPQPRGFFAPLGRWIDDRMLGRDRIGLGRVALRGASLSILLVGCGGSPGSPWSPPRGTIVFRMRWGSDILHGSLNDASAEAMIQALDQAVAYPLAGR